MNNILPKLPCPYPWMHHTINTAGTMLPCCHASLLDDKSWELNDFTNGLDTQTFDKIRSQLSNGEWPDICRTCKKREDDNIKSPRHYAIEKYKNFTYESVSLKFLEVQFTNTCNLMCRMCGPGNSSLIEKFYLTNERPLFMDSSNKIDRQAIKKVKYVKEAIKNGLEVLKVAGGEPFACKHFMEIINWCIENGYEKNLSLSMMTNGTKFSQSIINKMFKFKRVNIIISIDGTDNVYEYIRHGATWKTLCKNIDNILKLKKKSNTEVYLSVNCTLQSYNLHNIVDLARVVNEWGIEFFYVNTTLFPKDSELSIKWLPDSLVQPVAEEINSLKYTDTEFNSADVVNYIINNRNFNESKCNDLLKTTLLYDRQRGESYTKGLKPQLVEFLTSIEKNDRK